MNDIKEAWKNSKNLIIPKILFAKDAENKKYYIINDRSTILYMVSNNKRITYCIPKKYCSVKNGGYVIDNYDKMVSISCSIKNKYENFVINQLIK